MLAGLTTALEILDVPITAQRVLFLGAGSAAIGIAGLIASAMQVKGLSKTDALSRILMFDTQGLVVTGRKNLAAQKAPFAHDLPASKPFDHRDLASESPVIVAAIKTFKPTILIGVSTTQGLFTRDVVEAMSHINARPVIFSLSNPTEKTECLPEHAYAWSKGQALYAAGVQFPDVTIDGRTFHPGQANNFYIYPAIGLAVHVARPKLLNDECFIVAAQAMADQISDDMRASGRLFPDQSNILETEVTTAIRVVEFMFDTGMAQVERPADIRALIEAQLYVPRYGRDGQPPFSPVTQLFFRSRMGSLSVIVLALVPVAFVILLGVLAGRLGVISPDSSRVLASLALDFCLPALLFAATAVMTMKQLENWQFFLGIAIGLLGIYVVSLALSLAVFRKSMAASSLQALNSSFPNMAFMGVPVLTAVIGTSAVLSVVICNLVSSFVLLPLTLTLLDSGKSRKQGVGETAGVVVPGGIAVIWKSVLGAVKQPLVWAPLAGIAIAMLHIPMPEVATTSLNLIGTATSGVALFALGLVLSGQRLHVGFSVVVNTVFKMLAQPAVMLLLAFLLGSPAFPAAK